MSDNIQQLSEKVFSLVKWPFLLALIFQICAIFIDASDLLFWLANGALYLYLLVIIRKFPNQKIQLAASLGAIATLLLTFFTNLIKLFFDFKVWKIFSLITEPILYAFYGTLIFGLAIMIINKIKLRKEVK